MVDVSNTEPPLIRLPSRYMPCSFMCFVATQFSPSTYYPRTACHFGLLGFCCRFECGFGFSLSTALVCLVDALVTYGWNELWVFDIIKAQDTLRTNYLHHDGTILCDVKCMLANYQWFVTTTGRCLEEEEIGLADIIFKWLPIPPRFFFFFSTLVRLVMNDIATASGELQTNGYSRDVRWGYVLPITSNECTYMTDNGDWKRALTKNVSELAPLLEKIFSCDTLGGHGTELTSPRRETN